MREVGRRASFEALCGKKAKAAVAAINARLPFDASEQGERRNFQLMPSSATHQLETGRFDANIKIIYR